MVGLTSKATLGRGEKGLADAQGDEGGASRLPGRLMPLDRPPKPEPLCDVPPEHIDILWPKIEPLIERATATSRGKETAFDIRRSLMARDCQLWIWWEDGEVKLLAIAEIVRHPRKTVARIKLCTGLEHAVPREMILGCVAVIEAWAREQGATGMENVARAGWERVLRTVGYERTHVYLEKELADGFRQ